MKLFNIQLNKPKQASNGNDYLHYDYAGFYRDLNQLNHLNEVYLLLTKDSEDSVLTEHPVRFRGLPFDATVDSVKEQMGNPAYAFKNDKHINGHTVLFYRLNLEGYFVVAQLHFLDDSFFYASYMFQRYTTQDVRFIKKALCSKYFDQPQPERIVHFADEQKNQLFLTQKLYFCIHYISGNQRVTQNIKLKLEDQEAQQKRTLDNRMQTLKKEL